MWQEVQRLQREADEANKHSSLLKRDNQRFEVQRSDMAHQVHMTVFWGIAFFVFFLYLYFSPYNKLI